MGGDLMATLYSFTIALREAEFTQHGMTVTHSLLVEPMHREHFTGTLKEALLEVAIVSSREPRSHAAILTMRYPTDRKPAGFDNAMTTIRCNREEVPFV